MPDVTFGFDGNPDSLTVGTGSFAIPAGEYAQVSAIATDTDAHTVDGSTLLDDGGFADADLSGTESGSGVVNLYTNNTGESVEVTASIRRTGAGTGVHLQVDEGASETFIGLADTVTGFDVVTFILGNGKELDAIPVSGSEDYEWHVDVRARRPQDKPLQYFAPTGTVIDGGRYVAQRFLE